MTDDIRLLITLKLESISKKHNLQLNDLFIKVVCLFVKDFICLNLLITPQFRLYLFSSSLRNHVGKNSVNSCLLFRNTVKQRNTI